MAKKTSSPKPEFLIETSWEVCNKIGGIYAVLSTRAKQMTEHFGDNLLFIGPDFEDHTPPSFIEDKTLMRPLRNALARQGLIGRIGRWNVPGNPAVLLLRFDSFFASNNCFFGELWESFGVKSLNAYGDYFEAAAFSQAAAEAVKVAYDVLDLRQSNLYFHANEWTTGFAALKIRRELPEAKTLFTTHATSIGRSIAGNHKPLYDYLTHYDGDQMAMELNIEAKHSVEKATAHAVHCFTTVSDITARECEALLQKRPHVVTPNGFEQKIVPTPRNLEKCRVQARAQLVRIAQALTGKAPTPNALFLGSSGRYEFTNKGINHLLYALRHLNDRLSIEQEVFVFITVPADVHSVREDLVERLSQATTYPCTPLIENYLTHWLNQPNHDPIIATLNGLSLLNDMHDRVKVVMVPVYLDGADGVFDLEYFDILSAFDLTVYPSYYEPWGYTPLESIAFGVPTLTTDLAGFGVWASQTCDTSNLASGVRVIHRSDSNFFDSVVHLADTIQSFVHMTPEERSQAAQSAQKLSLKSSWKHFFKHYVQAYKIANSNA